MPCPCYLIGGRCYTYKAYDELPIPPIEQESVVWQTMLRRKSFLNIGKCLNREPVEQHKSDGI